MFLFLSSFQGTYNTWCLPSCTKKKKTWARWFPEYPGEELFPWLMCSVEKLGFGVMLYDRCGKLIPLPLLFLLPLSLPLSQTGSWFVAQAGLQLKPLSPASSTGLESTWPFPRKHAKALDRLISKPDLTEPWWESKGVGNKLKPLWVYNLMQGGGLRTIIRQCVVLW